MYQNSPQPLYNNAMGIYAKSLAHMRMGLSHLRSQLYSIHAIDDPTCEFCHQEREDPCHYLVRCDHFERERLEMVCELFKVIPPDYWISQSEANITNILLFGSTEFSYALNVSIQNIVLRYIMNTKRFYWLFNITVHFFIFRFLYWYLLWIHKLITISVN